MGAQPTGDDPRRPPAGRPARAIDRGKQSKAIEVMFAVIKTGGKQYRVAENDVIRVERLDGEAGASVTLDQVLMVGEGDSVTVGTPTVDGASVAAEVVEQGRGPKIIVFKKKRRQNYRRKKGHRQDLTTLKITGISAGA
jgi:large subunit ribosomal protein L21